MNSILYGIISIFAIIIGPILAIQLQKYLEKKSEVKYRKIQIFKTLMSTRAARLSNDHIRALNSIDLEFNDTKKDAKVITAWKEYFDHLCQASSDEAQNRIWITKSDEFFTELLYQMGISLGYNFDKVLIKRNVYSPKGLLEYDAQNFSLRENALKVLKGENIIAVKLKE